MVEAFVTVVLRGVMTGGVYALVAIGLTLIFGVMDVVNFAHGAYLMLAMYATYFIWESFGLDPFVAILVVAPLAFAFGAVSYRLVIHPIIDRSMFAQIFVTVGLIWIFENTMLFLVGPTPLKVNADYGGISLAGMRFEEVRLYGFLIAVVTVALLFILLYRTQLGLNIRATAESSDISELMGVNIDRIYLLTFGIGIGLVGVAGAVVSQISSAEPTVWSYYVLIAFVVVVLGGLGNVTGAMIAGPVIGVIEALVSFYFDPLIGPPVYYVIFIAVLVAHSTGRFQDLSHTLQSLAAAVTGTRSGRGG